MAWLMEECGVCASGAQQMIAYIVDRARSAGRGAVEDDHHRGAILR